MTTRTTARPRPLTWLKLIRRGSAHPPAAPARAAEDGLPRQTATPRLLRVLSVLAVLLTAAVGLSAYAIVSQSHRTVTVMAQETAPAVIAAGRAQAHLASADAAHAYRSVRDNPGPAGLLGQRYLSSTRVASKELGQALAENTAGSGAANLLGSAERGLDGYARLPYVWHFMHSSDSGILHKIGRARMLNRNVFDEQRSSPWLSPAVLALYLIPAATLLLLLAQTQRFLRRRFRRRLNLPLLAATGLIIVLSGWTVAQVVHTQRHLEEAASSLSWLTTLMQARTLVAEADTAEQLHAASGPGRWFGERIDGQLAGTPLTEPTVPPVGTAEKINVGAVLKRWNHTNSGADEAMSSRGDYAIGQVREDFQAFTRANRGLDEDAGRGTAELGEAAKVHSRAIQLDTSLDRLISVEKDRFDARMDDAGSRFELDVGIPLMALGSLVLTLVGLGARLNEYRGVR